MVDPDIQKVLDKKARRKAKRGGRIMWNTIFCNLIHQSFFYLDRTEMFMRVIWEILPTSLFYALFVLLFKPGSAYCHIGMLTVSVFLTHFLNWIFNNNFWNCMNSAFPWRSNRGTERTLAYLNGMKTRLAGHRSISGMMFLGSLSRFEWHDRSDIDMRLLRAPGLLNGISAALLMSRERVIAVFERQPLDAYLADTPEMLVKRRKDETPIFLLKRDARLEDGRFPMAEIDRLLPSTFNLK